MYKHEEKPSFGKLSRNNLNDPYPHRLNFYDMPPLYDVTIEEFEKCAIDRLRILAEIESSYARNRSWEDLKTVIMKQCDQHLPMDANTAITQDLQTQRRKDHIGHFVLRLAFCRSDELRRRFIKTESTLFRIRYDTDAPQDRTDFIGSRNFNWTPVRPEEKKMYEEQLSSLYIVAKGSTMKFEHESYYKVRWTQVPDLVEKRRVFLKGGYAFVPGSQQSSIIFKEFEDNLEKALEMTAKALPRLDEDDRLVPMLNSLSQGFLAGVPAEWTSATSAEGSDELKAEMIDELAQKHFPMCMRHLHQTLRREKRLTHFGRLQYGLFLKVLGLSIDEAIAFWRKSFSKITDDKFNKEYKYNIRHSYGLEGKRANYPAKSCIQILTGQRPDGADDAHGCPYLHFSPENLQTALITHYSSQGLTNTDLPEIMQPVKTKHYHVACTKVFEITHQKDGVKKGDGVGNGESVTHPNQYAVRSRELEKERTGPQAQPGVKVEVAESSMIVD